MTERINKSWQVGAYNRELNEWDITTLNSYDHQTEENLETLLVRQAAPVTLRPLKRTTKSATKEIVSLVGGDAQFPFADDGAIERFTQSARDKQPDEIILLGDMTDFPALSRFDQRKEWVGSTQEGIDQYYTFLASLRTNAPDARIVAVHGNHEQRLIKSLEKNLAEIAGIRVAMGQRALLSVQNLARYEELGVESVDGYPNGIYWLSDNLKAMHGVHTKTGGSNAARYLQTEAESTIYGHTHRQELAYKTIPNRLGHYVMAAMSPGALCKIDGSVPGFNYTPNADGEVVKRAENWQQGEALVLRTGNRHKLELTLYE